MKNSIDKMRIEILKAKIEFLKEVSKINDEVGNPYFNNKWLFENILNIKEIYCPTCLKVVSQHNDKTLAPECSCGWTGHMLDLLTEKEMKKELRKRKLDELESR